MKFTVEYLECFLLVMVRVSAMIFVMPVFSDRNIPIKVIHNASIMNAVGCCGLQLYRFGQTVSLCFFTETWRPDSFYERIEQNRDMKLHTLCLLGSSVSTL